MTKQPGSPKRAPPRKAAKPRKAVGSTPTAATDSATETAPAAIRGKERAGRVLSVASECAPLAKTGGLADVVGALPAAMEPRGWHLRTLIPAYRGLTARIADGAVLWSDPDLYGGPARILGGTDAGLDLLLLDAPHLFDRDGTLYGDAAGADWADNPTRFAALSRAAAEIARHGLGDGWRPDLLHAHDWQAGFAPLWSRGVVPSIMTIHNIAFQGIAPASQMAALRLPAQDFHPEGYEYWGQISALKAGLVTADAITTVSPTYARELTTPEFGFGLDGVIRARRDVLSGILNGVDDTIWNPATDPAIPANYHADDMVGKGHAARALRNEFGLDAEGGPLFIVVSRLTRQKGLDLLLETLPGLVARGGQLAVLGSGEPDLQDGFMRAAARWPGRVGVRIGYDEALSHRMFAGGEVVLVPSRFEPCGLTQLYGLAYGTLPLVARTGGLADTVIDANDAGLRAGVATGVQFAPVTADALSMALRHVSALYHEPAIWQRMIRRAMAHPVGWAESARQYAALYEKLMTR